MRKRDLVRASLAAAILCGGLLGGCSSGGGGGAPPPGTPSGSSTGSSAGGGGASGGGAAAPDFARLESEMLARKSAYVRDAAVGFAGLGEGLYTQIARLETGIGPLARAGIDFSLDKMDRREDTADFGATAILRILYRYAQSPLLPSDLKTRMPASILAFKFSVEDPGQDEMVYWSENHQILFAQCEYLAGHLFPQATFTCKGWTGAQHEARGKARVLKWLDHRLRFGFSEWNSPVYYEEDLGPLVNLADLAPDAEVRAKACMAIDVILFDLARHTHKGSFGVTAGRAYEEHKFSGWGQSVGDTIEVLFGTRGRFQSRGTFSSIFLATSTGYTVPHVLLGIGTDAPARMVDRARVGVTFGEASAQGIGFTSFDDGLFWWGQGAYIAPETIVTTRRMIDAWNLWSSPSFSLFSQIRGVPEALLPTASNALSPLTEGSTLAGANTVVFRTPDAMLSSVQAYRRGQVGFQIHAWQATLDMDACVFTTSPGTNGHDGPTAWTGSGSLPKVVQVDGALVAMYNPALAQKGLFPSLTHAYFPRAAFDEVVDQGSWTFGRKGDGYVALYTAQPATWTQTGNFAQKELVAPGDRNVWICQVGRAAEDGSFADFIAHVGGAYVAAAGGGNAPQTDRLEMAYEAPGVGRIEMTWDSAPTLNGAPIPTGGFARWDCPYAQVNFGQRIYDISFAGKSLHHETDVGTRFGDGL